MDDVAPAFADADQRDPRLRGLLLIPAVLALYRSLDGPQRPWAAFGCAVLAAAVPIILTLAIIRGRLMYPVYGIDTNDPATVALVVSRYYGGAHEVTLLLGAALIMLALTMRRGTFGRTAAAFGVAAGALQIAGAYPWLTGPLIARSRRQCSPHGSSSSAQNSHVSRTPSRRHRPLKSLVPGCRKERICREERGHTDVSAPDGRLASS
ncbi:hypothetical protein [Micromonospora sp. NPDC093277]|uniref:hypothetical protein n=1 Tax=Micromonospora sp. NPDC093277 TaxID=3364291 RepID=UPI003814A909